MRTGTWKGLFHIFYQIYSYIKHPIGFKITIDSILCPLDVPFLPLSIYTLPSTDNQPLYLIEKSDIIKHVFSSLPIIKLSTHLHLYPPTMFDFLSVTLDKLSLFQWNISGVPWIPLFQNATSVFIHLSPIPLRR